jgi:hypothetical protein
MADIDDDQQPGDRRPRRDLARTLKEMINDNNLIVNLRARGVRTVIGLDIGWSDAGFVQDKYRKRQMIIKENTGGLRTAIDAHALIDGAANELFSAVFEAATLAGLNFSDEKLTTRLCKVHFSVDSVRSLILAYCEINHPVRTRS